MNLRNKEAGGPVQCGDLSPKEIADFLKSYWGEDSDIASRYKHPISYHDASKKLRLALNSEDFYDKEKLLSEFANKQIAVGMRDKSRLVGFGALLARQSGEVEVAGSLVDESYRGNGVMSRINAKRRELLELFAKLDCRPMSYSVFGSVSIDYEHKLLSFPEFKMNSFFCNIAPYLCRRTAHADDVTNDWSIVENGIVHTSTVQAMAISEMEPSRIDVDVIEYAPEVVKALVSKYPYTDASIRHEGNRSTQVYAPSENFSVHTVFCDIQSTAYIDTIVSQTEQNNATAIVRIPLITENIDTLKRLKEHSETTHDDYFLTPTGLAVVDGDWACCYSTLSKRHAEHYSGTLSKLVLQYSDSLEDLSLILLNDIGSE